MRLSTRFYAPASSLAGVFVASLPGTAKAATTVTSLTESCNEVQVNFSGAASVAGKPTAKYLLYRSTNGGTARHIRTNSAALNRQFIDRTFLPGSSINYTYTVVAMNANGVGESSNTVGFRASALCPTPSEMRVGLLLVNCEETPLLQGATEVSDQIFEESAGAMSVANYLKEASYGQFRITREFVSKWGTIQTDRCTQTWDRNAGNVAPKGRWTGGYTPEHTQLVEDWIGANQHNGIRPDVWMVVTNRALAGDGGGFVDGIPYQRMGGAHFYEGTKGKKDTLHELGHVLGLQHTGSFLCSNGAAFPNTVTNVSAACKPAAYGGWIDPMGVSGYHFSTHQKYLFGWIPPSDVKIVNITPGQNSSVTVDMRDTNNSSGTRLIQVRFGPETFFLEYRRPIGFNDNWANQDQSLGAAIYVRYYPGRYLTCTDEFPCFDGNDVWIPHHPELATANLDNAYMDSHRALRVTMVSRSGRQAQVRIDHQPPPR